MHPLPIIIALLLAAPVPAVATGGDGRQPACVTVEVDGIRTLPYDCLSRQLAPPAPRAGAAKREASEAPSARSAGRPSNQLGLFNRSATSIRMGSNFGRSALPQRPPPSGPSPLIPRR